MMDSTEPDPSPEGDSSEFEFEFDDAEFDQADPHTVEQMDQAFQHSLQEKAADSTCNSDYQAFTFWFLIIVLLVFIFLLAVGAYFIVKGRARRAAYRAVGYR